MPLSREEIVAAIEARATQSVPFPVPEWGGDVLIRRLSAGDAERTGLSSDGANDPDLVVRVIAFSLVDADGTPLFGEDDVAVLSKADFSVATRVFAQCMKVNGLSSDALDEAVAAFTEAQRDNSSSS